MSIFHKARDWYAKNEGPISSLSLIGGFVFDALTLRQVTGFWENIFVLGHVVLVGGLMIWIQAIEAEPGAEANPERWHFWLVNILQFVFGGLLSIFLVFYFRSGDISQSWPFILVLALAFLANERWKRQFVRLPFQVLLFYLSLFSVSIYILPVVVHQIGDWIFIFSGFLSLIVIWIFLHIISRVNRPKWHDNKGKLILAVAGIYTLINIFYFTNLIPPLPLDLKNSGIYHSISKNADGTYSALAEKKTFWQTLTFNEDFHASSGTKVYAETSVFSPTDLNTTIVHRWQYYDQSQKKWLDDEVIDLPISGGRDSGFRTYSADSIRPGNWRVSVETLTGQVLGHIDFNVISGEAPVLEEKILD